MNGSSFGLCRYRLISLATLGGVVAVASISADAVVHGDTIVSTHGEGECDSAHVPDWIETQAAKAMVMLQHDAARSYGLDKTSGADLLNNVNVETFGTTKTGGADLLNNVNAEPSGPPLAPTLPSRTDALDHVTTSEIAPNASQDHAVISSVALPNASVETKAGAPVTVEVADPLKKPAPELHSASAPGSNGTSRKLALEATAGEAVDGEGGVRHSEKRKKRRQKKREVTSYWDKLPLFFALLAVPLLCLVTRNGTDNSKSDNDNYAEDYWDAQRSVGLHSK